jgi:hypothetical protein
MAALPPIVFDVNETLLDLQTTEPTFQRIFGDKGAMRQIQQWPKMLLPAQPVDATQVLNLSAGVSNPKVFRGRYFVQMSLRVYRQVGSLRKILSQQTIGVLIGTALPRTLRIAEVNVDAGR